MDAARRDLDLLKTKSKQANTLVQDILNKLTETVQHVTEKTKQCEGHIEKVQEENDQLTRELEALNTREEMLKSRSEEIEANREELTEKAASLRKEAADLEDERRRLQDNEKEAHTLMRRHEQMVNTKDGTQKRVHEALDAYMFHSISSLVSDIPDQTHARSLKLLLLVLLKEKRVLSGLNQFFRGEIEPSMRSKMDEARTWVEGKDYVAALAPGQLERQGVRREPGRPGGPDRDQRDRRGNGRDGRGDRDRDRARPRDRDRQRDSDRPADRPRDFDRPPPPTTQRPPTSVGKNFGRGDRDRGGNGRQDGRGGFNRGGR